jgi:hypothetical protein
MRRKPDKIDPRTGLAPDTKRTRRREAEGIWQYFNTNCSHLPPDSRDPLEAAARADIKRLGFEVTARGHIRALRRR